MKKHLLLVFLVLLTMVAYVGCSSSDSTDGDTDGDTNVDGDDVVDGDTDGGDVVDGDTDGDQVVDGDTDGDQVVDGDEEEEIEDGCDEDADCTDQICVGGECVDYVCEADADCDGATEECVDFRCVEIACTVDADCPQGYVCGPGTCVEVVDACGGDTTGYSIVVTGGNGFLAQGGDVVLSAMLLDADGANVVLAPGTNNFAWEIGASDPAILVAATDSNSATLTGGDTAGAVALEVTICADQSSEVTATVDFTNLPTPTDARVVVFDSSTGLPIEGADVYLSAVPAKDMTPVVTDANGVSTFTGLDCANGCNLHVLDADYTYVSAFGLTTNDILIPVAPNVDTMVAGGVKGHQDNAAVPEDIRGDVFLGITMFSIPGNLADLNFESLIGEMLLTRVQIGGTIDEEIPLPGGLEGYLNPDEENKTALKDGYFVTGIGGSGTLWGLGGFTNLADVLALAGPALGGGDIEIGPIVAALIPIFANFYHGIMPGVEFDEEPKVVDTDDLNGNEDNTDYIADFDKFLDLDLSLSQAQNQMATVTYGALPTDGDTCLADAAITLIGVMQTGVGFIPLGLSAAMDEDEDGNFDCSLGAQDVAFAPQHSGLSGYTYYTLSVALNVNELTAGLKADSSIKFSGSIARSATIPSAITVPDYPSLMSDVEYSAGSLTATTVAGADLHRIVFNVVDSGMQKYYHVYWNAAGTLDLSMVTAVEDRADTALVQAIVLTDDLTYDDLFSLNATNLNDMNGFIEGFSMSTLAEPVE